MTHSSSAEAFSTFIDHSQAEATLAPSQAEALTGDNLEVDTVQDWLVTAEGTCQPCETVAEFDDKPYRLYRFLTDIETILETTPDDVARLAAIRPLVRRLLMSSDWLQSEFKEPAPGADWSVLTLYREPNFPLTVQTVVWLPGAVSPIHNHATWGVVALISGQEKNTFWKRSPTAAFPDRIEPVQDCVLVPGDIISFVPEAIHQVEVMGEEPTITFNLYGVTDYAQRFEFDAVQQTAQKF